MYTVLFSVLFLITGAISGWLACERYQAIITMNEHEFDNLFETNPHPEIYNSDGKINRGEYMSISFDLGYNPDEFSGDDVNEL